ncbi:MAG: outer membrane beta-barrel protein, partial [Bacteroidota bacterium]
VCMLFAATPVKALEDMRFGLKGEGLFLPPSIDRIPEEGTQTHEGKMKSTYGGGAFLDYMVLEDMLSVGLEVGYSLKGYKLEEKTQASKKANSDQAIGMDIHSVDLAVPVKLYPMEREGGLAISLGLKAYLALAAKEKKAGVKDAADAEKGIVNTFNIGGTAGVEYEPVESGFLIGANYDIFLLGTLGDKSNDKAKAYKTEVLQCKGDDNFWLQGIQGFIGYDFGRMLED